MDKQIKGKRGKGGIGYSYFSQKSIAKGLKTYEELFIRKEIKKNKERKRKEK